MGTPPVLCTLEGRETFTTREVLNAFADLNIDQEGKPPTALIDAPLATCLHELTPMSLQNEMAL